MKFLRESPVEFLEPISEIPKNLYIAGVEGKFGSLFLVGTGKGIIYSFLGKSSDDFVSRMQKERGVRFISESAPFSAWIDSVANYLSGGKKPISAVVQPLLTGGFTLETQKFLTTIPFGKTTTYSEIAGEIGHPGAARAVGNACGKNRTLIIVPCHRVVAANGLGGFSAGLDVKKKLLAHEGVSGWA